MQSLYHSSTPWFFYYSNAVFSFVCYLFGIVFLKRKRSVKCKSAMNKFYAGFLMSVFLFCFCFLTEVYDNRFYMKGLHQLHSETPLQEDRLLLPQVLSKLALIFKFGRKKCWVYTGDAQSVWTTDFSIFSPAS